MSRRQVALALHERRQWPDLIDVQIGEPVRARAVTGLLLLGAGDEDEAAALLARLPDLRDASQARLRAIAGWVHTAYPGGNGAWVQRPGVDLVTAGLLVPVLAEPSVWSALSSDLAPQAVAQVLVFLLEAGEAFPETEDLVQDLFSRLGVSATAFMVLQTAVMNVSVLRRIDHVLRLLVSDDHVPTDRLAQVDVLIGDGHSLPLTVIAIRERQVANARSTGESVDLACAVRGLGVGLERVGRYSEALPPTRRPRGCTGRWSPTSPPSTRTTSPPRYTISGPDWSEWGGISKLSAPARSRCGCTGCWPPTSLPFTRVTWPPRYAILGTAWAGWGDTPRLSPPSRRPCGCTGC